MSVASHGLAGILGALLCGGAGAGWCALSGPAYEAGALASFQSGAALAAAPDLRAIRALVSAEPVLRRAALRPEAAAIVERAARPDLADRLIDLAGRAPGAADTLSRAVATLAPRVDARPGPWPDTLEITARMASPAEAAAVATAVAESLVAELNETGDAARRRLTRDRADRLDRAARRLDEAQARVQLLRAADPAPTATIAQRAAPAAGGGSEALQRAATEAAARLAEASRIYGPRHPELIARETEARRARAAFETARGAQTPAPRETATGGPDPRAAEIAVAEEETQRARLAYDLEMSRNETIAREARVLKPAAAPTRAQRPDATTIVPLAALFGFFAFAGAPALLRMRPAPARRTPGDREIARLRGGAFDRAGARRALDALAIEARDDAVIVLLASDDGPTESTAAALIEVAMRAGWRPLLVEPAAKPDVARGAGVVGLAGQLYATREIDTPLGPLARATPAGRTSRADAARDAALAFDLILIDAGMAALRTQRSLAAVAHNAIRVAPNVSDARARRLGARLALDAEKFVGTIVTG